MKGLWLALAAVALLIAGGVAFELNRRAEAREARVQEVLALARIELERDDLDRDAVMAALRRLRELDAGDPRPLRARAWLQLALGRYQDAWDAMRRLALAPDPEPEDAGLAARILMERYQARGEREDAERAASFAHRHYRATGDVGSLFLAWQAARRIDAGSERTAELARELVEGSPEDPRARLVAALGEEGVDPGVLRELERELEEVPIELEAALARVELDAALAPGQPRRERVQRAERVLPRIERVLAAYPASLDARSAAALAYHLAGDKERRDAHLRWLLDQAPATDERRSTWSGLLEAPVIGRR